MDPLAAATIADAGQASPDEWLQTLQGAAQLLVVNDPGDDATTQALAAVETQLDELAEQVGLLTRAYEGALQTLDTAEQALDDELEAIRGGLQDRQSSLAERGEQFAGTELPGLGDAADERLAQAESRWTQALGEDHGRLVEAFDDHLRGASQALGDQLQSRAQALGQDVIGQLGQVGDKAAAAFTQRVAQEAREAGEKLVADMGREISEQMLLSQASLAITGALGPLLPQLVALRVAVGAIKTALKIARGGF